MMPLFRVPPKASTWAISAPADHGRRAWRLALLLCLWLPCQAQQPLSDTDPWRRLPAEQRERLTQLFYDAAIAQSQQNYQLAVDKYQQILAADPKHAASVYNLARILVQSSTPEQGLPYAQRALDLAPDNVWTALLMAEAYEKTRSVAKAVAVLEAAVRRFPDNDDLRFHLADEYLTIGSEDKALALLDTLERRTGRVEEIALKKRQLFLFSKQGEKAIAETRKLTERFPQNTQYRLLLYETYRMFGKSREAALSLESLLDADPNNEQALFTLAEYYLTEAGEPERGMAYLTRALDNPAVGLESKVRFLNSRLALLSEPKLRAQLLQQAERLYRRHPSSAGVLALRGHFLALAAEPDSARAYFRRSLRLDETNRGVWEQLVTLEYNQQRWAELQQASEDALVLFPLHVPFHFARGVAAFEQADYATARSALDRVLKFAPSDPSLLQQTHALLAESQFYLHDFASADANYRKALELDPSHPGTLGSYAYMLAVRGERLDEAAQMAQRAVKSESKNPALLDTYGWVLYRQGKYADAVKQLEQARELGGGAEVLEHLGDAYFRDGKAEQALELWKQALAQAERAGLAAPALRLKQKIDSGKI